MACECVVAAVVCRNCHDGARSVAGQHIVGHPDGNVLTREGIDGIAAGEHARHALLDLALALGLVLHLVKIGVYQRLLLGSGEQGHIFGLRSEHHEGDAEDGVGAGGEYLEVQVPVGHPEVHFGTLAAAYPVALGLLEAFAPVQCVETGEEARRVGRDAQAPLAHHLLLDGMAAANGEAFRNLVVGQNGAEGRTPVHHSLAAICDAVVHQHVGLFALGHGVPFGGGETHGLCVRRVDALGAVGGETLHQAGYRHGLVSVQVII